MKCPDCDLEHKPIELLRRYGACVLALRDRLREAEKKIAFLENLKLAPGKTDWVMGLIEDRARLREIEAQMAEKIQKAHAEAFEGAARIAETHCGSLTLGQEHDLRIAAAIRAGARKP